MNKHYIILIVLFFLSFSIACIGITDCYDSDGDNFYEKYKLRGPDAYYNMKMCKDQLEGTFTQTDYDLAYPNGDTTRPIFFTITVSYFSAFVHELTGMPIEDALGFTMLLIPCLFGALLVFPVYFIAEKVFFRKIALISSFFVVILPYLYNSSHGGLAGLFDHDSFILFFTVAYFYFFMQLITVDLKKDRLWIKYSLLSSFCLSIIFMSWVAYEFIFVSTGIFVFLYLVYSVFKKEEELVLEHTLFNIAIMFLITWLITLPYNVLYYQTFNIVSYSFFIVFLLFLGYLYLDINKWSQKLQLGFLASILAIFTTLIFFARNLTDTAFNPLISVSNFLFKGIYTSRVMSTIAEAQSVNLTGLFINYGFFIFIISFFGFILYLYKLKEQRVRKRDLFIITMFIITLFFTTEALRFAKDLLPFVAIFGAVFFYCFVKEINLKELKLLKFKPLLYCTIIFMVFASSIYITLDNVSSSELYNEDEWVEICNYINNNLDDESILAWWDYGFYIASMTDNPVVADNFQNGIVVSCNFLTSQSEKDAIDILSMYLIKSEQNINGNLSKDTKDIIKKHFRVYSCKPCGKFSNEKAMSIISFIENNKENNYFYQELAKNFSFNDISESYEVFNEIKESTGFNIKYVIVSKRETLDIKIVVPYLAEKSNVGFTEYEDDWFSYENGIIKNKFMFNNSFLMQLWNENSFKYFVKVKEINDVKIWRIGE